MSRRIPFTEAAVSRAVKGARKAGMPLSRVEIDQAGKIVLVAGEATVAPADGPQEPSGNEWEGAEL